MKLYDFVCENEEIIRPLIKAGVIPIDINNKVKVYRTYLEQRQDNGRMQAAQNTADETKQSIRNVFRIVERMEQGV